jgi:hypothetical protein
MNIERSVIVSLNEKEYKLNRPNNGQLLEIEVMKHRLSGGLYQDLVFTNLISSQNTINTIDMISNMSVLCPEIIKDLKINIAKIDIIDSLPILKVYMSEVHPWVTKWQSFIQEVSTFISKQKEEDAEE